MKSEEVFVLLYLKLLSRPSVKNYLLLEIRESQDLAKDYRRMARSVKGFKYGNREDNLSI